MDFFVTGRLCLFGEHSDWAAEYCPTNADLASGYAIVVGTNQGIYARVEVHHKLIFKTINQPQVLELVMEPELLLGMAKSEEFFSYVAGVAYQALTHYGVGGLEIDNYLTDLPLKKGLSSSAAVCVLVARAFNHLYGLKLTIQEEMELAYQGERTTPSHCGRLDQACAYGGQPVLMTFNGFTQTIEPLATAQPLYLIIVDLGGVKDTQVILAQLHQCYPFAQNTIQTQVQNYLSKINPQIVKQAVVALNQGNAQELGNLMCQAQAEFDHHLIPACPEQLKSPLLHQLLNHPSLQPYIFGGKGVGSQGDGTAQLVARNQASQKQAIALIQEDFPDMQCFELNILPSGSVK